MNMDEVIAIEGGYAKELPGRPISASLEKVALERKVIKANKKDRKFIKITDTDVEFFNEIICPIISSGDVVGTISFMGKKEKEIGDLEEKLVRCAAIFLAKQFE